MANERDSMFEAYAKKAEAEKKRLEEQARIAQQEKAAAAGTASSTTTAGSPASQVQSGKIERVTIYAIPGIKKPGAGFSDSGRL